MELSTEISSGLKRIANTSLVSEENLDILLSEVSTYLENPFVAQHKVGIVKSIPRIDVLKESYAAIITFLLESIRKNIDPDILKLILLDHKIQDSRSEKILNVLFSHKLSTQNALRRFNSDPPQVYDVSWKMNYCVKSSFSDFDGKCLYFITLNISGDATTKTESEGKCIKFACTVQQLQSLVASLKAAVRQLENVASLSK